MQHGMTQRNLEKIAYPFIRPDCTDTLLATFYLNLKCPAQNIKKGLILKPSVTKAWKIDIGKEIQIVKYRDVIHKPEPFDIYAPRLTEFVIQWKHKIFWPLGYDRFGQYSGPEIVLAQC